MLHVIAGCMFSGKTEELIREVRRWQYTGAKTEVYVHTSSVQREGLHRLRTRSGWTIPATPVRGIGEVLHRLARPNRPDVVAIDEAHFFEVERTVAAADFWADSGMKVIVAGLDTDFRGEPFGPVPYLLSIADSVTKLSAVCMKCGNPHATRTQRLVDGEPAPYESPLILPGDRELYEARCRDCHRVPGKLEHRVRMRIKEDIQ